MILNESYIMSLNLNDFVRDDPLRFWNQIDTELFPLSFPYVLESWGVLIIANLWQQQIVSLYISNNHIHTVHTDPFYEFYGRSKSFVNYQPAWSRHVDSLEVGIALVLGHPSL